FQAEDGIRDGHVTGVQTCALPILLVRGPVGVWASWMPRSVLPLLVFRPSWYRGSSRGAKPHWRVRPRPARTTVKWGSGICWRERSEERRVGKECRCRGSTERETKK